jgi:GT2 family glycosyltransferase
VSSDALRSLEVPQQDACLAASHPATCLPAAVSPTSHVAIVILHWGSMEVTAGCLRSLSRVSFAGRTTVVLIDNARSFDPVLAGVDPRLEVEVHRPPRNLGFAQGCVQGITRARQLGATLVLLLNNDVQVEPEFLDHLVQAAAESPEAGLLCPKILTLDGRRKPWYLGGTFSLWSGIPVQARPDRRSPAGGEPREVDYATGCVMLIKPAVVERIGSFDPSFFAYCEDLDFSLRARRAGFKILLVPRAVAYHAASDDERLSLGIYYSTRNLLEVMRRHAAWYHWIAFPAHFLVRWLGFFALLGCVRRRPEFVFALTRGAVDFLRGGLGERGALR